MKKYYKPAKIALNVIAIIAMVFYPGGFALVGNAAHGSTTGNGNPGSIKTTNVDCGSVQTNVNHYDVGDHVYIHGNGDDKGRTFDPGTYDWDITGKPGKASQHPNTVVAHGSFTVDATGIFCFDAYTILPGDGGTYGVTFNDKHDNYRVHNPAVCTNPLDYVDDQGNLGEDGEVSLSDATYFTNLFKPNSLTAKDPAADVNDDGEVDDDDKNCAKKYYSTGEYACPIECDDEEGGKKDKSSQQTVEPTTICSSPLDYVHEDGTLGADGKIGLGDAAKFEEYYATQDSKANVYIGNELSEQDVVDSHDQVCADKYYATGEYACALACPEDYFDQELTLSTEITPKSNPLVFQPVCTEGSAWANEVISSDQGTKNDGGVIDLNRSDATQVLGANDGVFFSLGRKIDHPYGGTITVKFAHPVVNIAGADLTLYEVTNGDRVAYGVEKAQVSVSQDGITWGLSGEINNQAPTGIGEIDISNTGTGWTWIQYVQITDATDFESEFSGIPSADGYDLNAIQATYQLCSCVSPLDLNSSDGTNVPDGEIGLSDATLWTQYFLNDNPRSDVNGNGVKDYGDYLCAKPYFADGGPYTCDIECAAVCGDASVNQETEQCDDGNITSGDGCSSICQIEPQTGSLTICKYNDVDLNGTYDDGTDLPLQWSMTVDALSGSNEGDTWFTGTNSETGCVTLEGFPYGNYDVTEATVEGWTGTYPSDTDMQNVTLDAETPNPVVTFLNAQNTPASLTISKTDGLETADAGATLPYAITVTNTGETEATGVEVVDAIPTEVASVSNISDSGVEGAGIITWENLTIPALSSITLTFDGILNAEFPDGTTIVHNEATLDCSEPNQELSFAVLDVVCPFSGTGTDDTSVTITPEKVVITTAPILTIEKNVDKSSVVAGSNVTYTITITNNGDGTAENVVLADPLPGDFYITLNNNTAYNESVGDLAAGDAVTTSYTVTIPSDTANGDYVNTATVSASNYADISDSATVTVSRPGRVLGEDTQQHLVVPGTIIDDTTAQPTGKVLGAEDLAETGAGLMEYIMFTLAALMIGFGIFGIRKANIIKND
ncbi:MAG: NEW3 domain-containing protein [Patescibacteria group bacterium]|jgi:uncharacterized repeat protein (TIGR01451 family)